MAGPWEKYQAASQDASAEGPWKKYQTPSPDNSGPSQGETALRSVASGITGGFDDELTGAIGGAGRIFGIKNLGSWKPFDPNSKLETTSEPPTADAIVEAYRQNRDAIRDQQSQDMAKNPGTTIAGNLAGAFISPISKIGAATEGVQTVSKGQQIAQAMKSAATQGAIFGAGSSNSDLTKGDVGQFVKDTTTGAVTGAVVPPGIEAAGYGLKKGAQAAGWASKKMFSSLFGVTEDNASQYLARRGQINAAPELSQIKDGVDGAVKKLSDAVDSGKIQMSQAQDALNDLKTTVRNQLVDAKVDARDAVRRTEVMFKEAAANLIQPLKDTHAPTQIASDVVNAVSELKSGLSDKAGAAWETLEQSNKTLPTKVVKGELTKAINSLKVGGSEGGAVGQSSQAAINSLQGLRDQLDALPDKLSMSQVKQIVKNLDRDINWRGGAGEFMDPASQEKLGIRRAMDAYMKRNVEGYEQAMAPVAQDSQLLDKVGRPFGDERAAIGRLGQIAGPKGELDRQALAQLEQATGRPGAFTGAIDQYARAQTLLKDPQALEQMKRALPEYQSYRQAMAKLAKMRPDWTRDQLDQALSKSKEARALSMAEGSLAKSQDALAPVSGLSQNSTQSKLESFLRPKGAPIETQRALQRLDDLGGSNFTQQLKDRAVLDSFEKGNVHGSRNTLFYGLMGAAFHGIEGATIGATFGHQVMDRYGPRVGKTILDGIAKIQESPTVQTIRSLNLPPNVKSDLEREFNVYMITRNKGEIPSKVAGNQDKANRSPATGEDRWAQSGAKSLGIEDADAQSLMASPRGKQLLIQASDYKPGSPQLKKINDQIQKMLKGAK